MEIISGFEGKDVDNFIKTTKEVWQTQGAKARGAKARYKIIIGKINQRAIFAPTVATTAGTESILIWNLNQKDINKIEETAKNESIPISYRSYLWYKEIPTILPNELEEEAEKNKVPSETNKKGDTIS